MQYLYVKPKRNKSLWIITALITISFIAILFFPELKLPILQDIRLFFSQFDKDPLAVPGLAIQPTDTEKVHGLLSVHQWDTKNGVPVYFVPTENLPIVDIKISFDAGSARDGTKPGLSTLMASMLLEGTESLSEDAFLEQLEGLGVQYHVEANRDNLIIELRSLTNPNLLNPAIELISALLTRPALTQGAFERVKRQHIVNYQEILELPRKVAEKKFYETVYANHPYGHLTLGTEAGLESIELQDVKDFKKQYLHAQNALLVISGGIHRDRVKDIANKLVTHLPGGNKPEPIIFVPSKEAQIINIPLKTTQSHIWIGEPVLRENDPDYYPLLVGNHIFGKGQFTSRLFKEVRAKKGLAYSVKSHLKRLKVGGPFVITLQTEQKQTQLALNIVQDLLSNFGKEGPQPEELELAKQNLIKHFPLSINTNKKINDKLFNYAFYHLPMASFNEHTAKIQQVTKEQIQEVWKRRINLHHMQTVIVGE